MIRFCRSLAWIAAALAFSVAAAQAQTGYPDRPVKIIVPIGPGGSYDLVGRHLADALSKRAGQSFFVENKPSGRKDMPQAKLQDIVAAAKANPGSISVATAGVGTGQHLVAAAFMKAAGVKLLEVPYKGLAASFHRSARRPYRSVLRLRRSRPAICAVGAGKRHRRAVVQAQSACA